MHHRLRPLLVVCVLGCGSKASSPVATNTTTPAASATTGHADVRSAVLAFNAALSTADTATIRAQFPNTTVLSSYLDCADKLAPMFDDWSTALPKNGDIQAMKGKQVDLVGIEETFAKEVQVGPFEGECRATTPFAIAKVKATWRLEGEDHTTALTLLRLDGRWHAFDLPEN
jgi:hypothetical protein